MTREEREREQARAHIWDSILFLSTALWLVWATRKNSFTVCHTRVPVQMMHIDLSRIIKACFPAYFQQTSWITFPYPFFAQGEEISIAENVMVAAIWR